MHRDRLKQTAIACGTCLLAGMTAAAEVSISNLSAAQQPGTKQVTISYDMVATETDDLILTLTVSNGASVVSAASASGDLGVKAGPGRSIVWDAGADWSGNVADLLYTLAVGRQDSYPSAVAKTGQTTSYHAADDGELQPGEAWPDPRFTDQGDDTILDNLTSLEWAKAPHALTGNPDGMHWESAIDFCNALNHAAHDDWRLPSRNELMSLLDFGHHNPALPAGHPFVGLQDDYYWSATTRAARTNDAWFVMPDIGISGFDQKNSYNYLVWPVRRHPNATVRRTGQTTSYRMGDDGHYQLGSGVLSQRFTDHGDGTASDTLTGLMWAKEPRSLHLMGSPIPWDAALDVCNMLDHAGHSDWRLPSVRELNTLLHYGAGNWGDQPLEWLNSNETPFSGIQEARYWSGTAGYSGAEYDVAYNVTMDYGHVFRELSGYGNYVWPVRSQPTITEPVAQQTTVTTVDSRDYTLTVASDHGAPTPSVGAHDYAWQSSVTCAVAEVAADGWMFMGWSGDATTDYTATNVVVLMDTLAKAVQANFSDDADNDGLLNTNEFSIGTDPRNSDSDDDKFDDGFEVAHGYCPTNSDAVITDYIHDNGASFDLYASNVVLHASDGQMLQATAGGKMSLTLQLEQSDDLQTWTNASDTLQWELPVGVTKKYFRVRAGK